MGVRESRKDYGNPKRVVGFFFSFSSGILPSITIKRFGNFARQE